ncbi:RAP domain protein [Toxoplasma gondii p89]|uniref:RAP domain protein n=1 Tax=Toxoplasma gondii p89 TaxID=943119 RepID=A0A086L5I5_TOXGO|nr:RAP domain protein [Toxoplasma gondii p89]
MVVACVGFGGSASPLFSFSSRMVNLKGCSKECFLSGCRGRGPLSPELTRDALSMRETLMRRRVQFLRTQSEAARAAESGEQQPTAIVSRRDSLVVSRTRRLGCRTSPHLPPRPCPSSAQTTGPAHRLERWKSHLESRPSCVAGGAGQSLTPECTDSSACLPSRYAAVRTRSYSQLRMPLFSPASASTPGAYARICPPFTVPFASREEEKKVLMTLHAVQQYDDDTKLSLKVFHLQELAQTSMTFSQLSLDERFLRLLRDIHANAKDLSPAQLQALAVSCRELNLNGADIMWKTVARHIVRLTKSPSAPVSGITFSQVAHAMSCFASKKAEVQRHLRHMLKYILQGSRRLNEHDIVCVLYTLRRYNCNATETDGRSDWPYLRCLRLCASIVESRLADFHPRFLVYIIYEFALTGVVPWRLVYRSNNLIKQSVHRLSDKELALYVLASSKYCLLDTQLLKRIGRRLSDDALNFQFSNASLSMLLYGFASMNFREKNLIKLCCERIQKAACTLEEITVAQLAYALGRLGVREEATWKALAKAAADCMDCMSPAEISSTVHAAGKVGFADERLFSAVVEHATKLQVAFNTQQLLNLLDGLALAGFFHQQLYQTLLDNFVQSGGEDDIRGVNQLRRVMFTILLEFSSFLENVPQSIQLLAEQHQQPFLEHQHQPYHPELKACFEEMDFDASVLSSKGAYTFDAKIKIGPNAGSPKKTVALDLLSEGNYCPISGELLGVARLKRRHMKILGWKYVDVRRKTWLKLRTREERCNALRDAIATQILC